MAALLALLLSFAPALACAALVYWLDRFEKEPRMLLGAVFGWGAGVAVLAALLSELALEGAVHVATGSAKVAGFAGTALFAPLAEESLKGFAVLVVFWAARREFDDVLDGIVYAGVVALGFAATENFLYLYGESLEHGVRGLLRLFVVRGVLGAWDHPFYTAFVGIGLAVSRLARSAAVRSLAPPAGWAVAVGCHALHNTLATLAAGTPALAGVMWLVDWSGWLAMGLLILWALRREAALLAELLAEEVAHGRRTAAQYRTAVSSWAQSGARLRAACHGRLALTRRFYQVCGELAHKKHQLALLGDEGCNAALVEQLRAELGRLSPEATPAPASPDLTRNTR